MKNKTSVPVLFTKTIVILSVAALAFVPLPAHARKQVPFKAVFDTEFDSTVAFPIASVHVVGEGPVTHLGLTQIETTDQVVNLVTGSATATYHFVAANGDDITVLFTEVFLPATIPPNLTFLGSWTITGGTGRFAGASGSGTTEGTVIFTGPDVGVGHFTMTGTISSPGSLK